MSEITPPVPMPELRDACFRQMLGSIAIRIDEIRTDLIAETAAEWGVSIEEAEASIKEAFPAF